MKDIELPPLPERIREFADGADIETIEDYGRECARAAVEANSVPEFCDPSCTTYDVAAMVMSDCGHSTNNQRLLDRVAERIDKHLSAMLSASPAPAQQEGKPMTDEEIRAAVINEGMMFTYPDLKIARAVERHHGIKE